MSRTLIVVFGAAVKRDGTASATLARRVGYAAAAAQADPGADLFCSGARGRFGPAEAEVMAAMLDGAVSRTRLHLDTASPDTLATVRAASAFFHSDGYDRLLIATDGYHQPRVRMLFALFGVRARAIPFPLRGSTRLVWRMRLREVAALPYDLVAGGYARLRARRR